MNKDYYLADGMTRLSKEIDIIQSNRFWQCYVQNWIALSSIWHWHLWKT